MEKRGFGVMEGVVQRYKDRGETETKENMFSSATKKKPCNCSKYYW